jgi:hypothetical protein
MKDPTLYGTLSDWLTVGMATQMLGVPSAHTSRFYEIVKKHALPLHKIGGTTLVNAIEFARAAGLPAGTSPPWPAELARLPMASIYSRTEVSQIFDISITTVYKWVEQGRIQQISLEEWNTYPVYYIQSVKNDPVPITIKAFGRELKIAEVDGELQINIKLPKDSPELEATCFHPQPQICWFTSMWHENESVAEQSYIKVEVNK